MQSEHQAHNSLSTHLRRSLASSQDEAACETLKSVLRSFALISWNLAGLTASEVSQLFIDITMNCFWTVIFIQEFSGHTEPVTLDTCNSVTYVFPGISAQSRSNAISISSALNRHVAFSDVCRVGGLVALKIGDLLIVCITLHVPYSGYDLFQNTTPFF